MDTVRKAETVVEHCRNCGGIYFEKLNQALLDPVKDYAEEIDTGAAEMGAGFDEMIYVECPKCDSIMDQRLIEAPNRIRFEFCPTCSATFLDAGELRKYTSPELFDDFKSLLPER